MEHRVTGKRTFIASTAGIVLACLALSSFTGPASAVPARTTVHISSLPRIYGYVESPKPVACGRNRVIQVFRVKPGEDRRVGTSRTRSFRGDWQWSIPSGTGNGRFYAKAKAKAGCRPGKSKIISVTPKSVSAEECPITSGEACWIGLADNPLQFSSGIGETCPNFGSKIGDCDGRGYPGSRAWSGNDANFHWSQQPDTTLRGVAYYVGDKTYLEGSVPRSDSARYSIRDAVTKGDDRHWCTPDLPGEKPGDLGGPLYINFIDQIRGATVRFHGYLTRKRPTGCWK
ncbi:MAG: hypothetical protein JJE13_12135 [Thermoleophilia bacterium]|nr:hypothetical protein [Thermoleophilia bacterium]